MRSVWEKIWLRLLIVVLILGLTVVGLVVRYIKYHFEDDDSYTITVTKTHVDGGTGRKMIMVYDKEGKLLMYQSDSRLQGLTYDEQGNVLSRKLYYLNGELVEEVDYTYNDQGQLILAKGADYAETYDHFEIHYSYDSDGNRIGVKNYSDGELTRERTYDAQGNLVEETTYNGDTYYLHTVYTYSDDGRILSSRTKRVDGYRSGTDYTYDGKNRLLIEANFRTDNGKTTRWSAQHTYDVNGNRIRTDYVDSKGGRSSCAYTYDAMGNMLSYMETADGKTTGRLWTYDAQGRMLTYEFVGKSEDFSSHHSWTYDEDGNVVTYDAGRGYAYTFTYQWPDWEMPQEVADEVAHAIAVFTEWYSLRSERYADFG